MASVYDAEGMPEEEPDEAMALAVEDAREKAEAIAMRLMEDLKSIIGKMEQEATRRVGQRQTLEDRWIEDLRQYHGLYDEKTERALSDGNKSKLYINMTRPKTDAMSARLMDLLFPTDDKNWGIQPTPVPSLKEEAAKKAREAAQEAAQKAEATKGTPAQQQAQEEARAAISFSQALEAEIEEAKLRAERMEREIDDQLKESLYHAAMRDVIEDACKLGTGVCKGPVTGDTVRKGWKKRPVQDETGQEVGQEYALEMSAGDQPAIRHVDIWGFFPDMDARTIEESQGVYQRHLMNAKKLRALAKLPGFDQDAIRTLLKGKARTSTPSYLSDLRNLGASDDQSSADLYHVWEYSGPIEAEDMMSLALAANDEATAGELAEADPLQELYAIVWFCQGELLKFALYPYDSYECMYSVFSLAKDEASIFGYGIPTIMRDPQQSLNAAWRAMMDNAGLSTGPQIVIAKEGIEPADGVWELAPRKVWWATSGAAQVSQVFGTFDIPMQQQELGNLVATSKQIIDEMTAMPQIAQGEQGTGVTKTAQGMALLMNSANVVFRRIVKHFDDDMTTPNIRRFYDWNMQFNEKEEIKGDFEVDARGSSVLLVREMQAQNLMMIAMQLGAHPVFGSMLDNRKLLKKMFQAHMLSPDDVMLSDDEIDAMVAQAAKQQGDPEGDAKAAIEQMKLELEQAKLEADIELKNMEIDAKRQIALLDHQTAMMKMAEQMNMQEDKFARLADEKRAELEARLSERREERASKERIVAAETAMKQRTGDSAGGYV